MSAVRINMQVGGIAEVRRAFKSVASTVADFEQKASKEAQQASRRREVAAQRESQTRMKLASKERVEQTKALASVDREWAKLALHQQKRAEKLADDRARSEQKANDKIRRDAQATADYLQRVRLNSAKSAGKIALQQAKEEELAAKKRQRALEGGVRGGVGIVGRGIGNVASMGIRLAGAGMALGGGFAVADAMKTHMSAEAASIGLANSLYKGGGGKRYSNTKLLDMASRVQGSSGVGKEELLAGWSSYVAKSGDSAPFDGDEKNVKVLEDLAKLSKATGSNMSDVMNAAGMLRMQNSSLSGDEMLSMMRDIVAQGKEGAVEIGDLARVAGRVTAGATSYAGNQTDNQRKLLGLTQVAMQTSGSPEDAATAVSRFAADVGKHAKENKARGVNVLDANNKLLSPAEILEQYFKATKGNTLAMGEGKGNLGLGAESMKIAQAMSATYDEEFKRTGSVDKAAAKVKEKVSGYGSLSYSAKDVDGDLSAVRKGTQERFNAAMMKISDVVERRGAPMIEKLADALDKIDPKEIEKLVDAIASFVEWFAENPWKGLGLAVTGSIVKELASAGLGSAVSGALSSGISAAGPGMSGIIGGAIAAAIAGAAIGAAIAQYGEEEGSKGQIEDSRINDETYAKARTAQKLRKKVASGEALTLDEKNSLEKMRLDATTERADAEDNARRVHNNENRTWGEAIVDFRDSVKGDPNRREVAADQRAGQAQYLLDTVNDALQENQLLPQRKFGPPAPPLTPGQVVDADAVKSNLTRKLNEAVDEMKRPGGVANPDDPKRNGPFTATGR